MRSITRTKPIFGGVCAIGAMLLFSCLSDPREDEAVTLVDSCDYAKLSPAPISAESTLRAYLDSTDLLLRRAQTVANELRDACNAVDSELHGGTPSTAADVTSACSPIAARIETVAKKDPTEPPPGSPAWAELRFAPSCTTDDAAYLGCVSSFAPACDASKCDPAQLAGKCAGDCNGTCITRGDAIACAGKCVGEVPIVGLPTTCSGECDGVCTNASWSGECQASCAGFFRGSCAGTCTGTCDGAPVNVALDAGTADTGAPDSGDIDAGDASDAGDPDAGAPPPAGGPPALAPPPANADGNCKGFCVGVCSSGANGACAGSPCLAFDPGGPPALGPFRGYCLGTCAGVCKSGYGTGATQTCNGECTEVKKACDGTCVGDCNGTRGETVCHAALHCEQNAECENACQTSALLATTCNEPKVLEVYAVTDPDFVAALEKHGAKIGKALSELATLRAAFGFVGDRAYGDFLAIGLSGDLARACVAKGAKNAADADALLRAAIAADPSVRKFQ